MDESTERKWNIRLKAITSVTTVIVLAIGLWQYYQDNERSYRKVLYDNQFELYEEILGITSALATTSWDSLVASQPHAFPQAKKDFLKFYYGKLILVEDTVVETQMIELKRLLEGFEEPDINRINISMREIKTKCIHLALACRSSLEKTWGIKLDVLKRKNY